MPRPGDALVKLLGAKKLEKILKQKQKIARGDCCETVAEMYEQLAAVTEYCRLLETWIAGTLSGGGGKPPPPPPEWP